ncbi:MAG: hypothetical protein M3115_01055 [Thermoproteota archaeon]|nr:hypothetical protein [Thermoproteota archaeon]
MIKILQIIKSTHRHPINQALHSAGAPFYGIGLAMVFGHLIGMQTNPVAGSSMFLAAVAMFVLGHRIEGNLSSMAPVLLSRLIMVLLMRRISIIRSHLEAMNQEIKVQEKLQ